MNILDHVKSKTASVQAMKTYGDWRYDSTHSYIGISWRWVFRFAPTGQQTPVPTEKETGWAPDRRCNTYWVFPVAPSSRSLLSAQQRVCKHSVRCCALQHTAKAGRPTFHPRLWPQHELRALTNKTESCYPRTYIRVKNTWGLRNP